MMALSRQQIFDKAAKHLLKQDCRASRNEHSSEFACFYRGPNGTKCAVGALIPDRFYHESMEEKSAAALLAGFPDFRHYLGAGLDVSKEHSKANLLTCLQEIHDCYPPDSWREKLRYLAFQVKLKATVLDD